MFKIVKSLFVIVAVATIAAGSTSAYFSDTAQVAGNTFSAGTLDLKVNGQDSLIQAYKISNLKPGAWDLTGQVVLNNAGSINGHAWLEITNVQNNDGQLGGLVKASFQKNVGPWTRYGGTSSIDTSQNVRVDLFDLAPGESIPLVVYAVWPNGDPVVDNTAQGDSVTFDVIFHLDQ